MSYYENGFYLEPPAPRSFDESDRQDALSALLCPYYNTSSGGCVSGCYEEPRCQTDEPEGGWELPTPYGMHILEEFREKERKRMESEAIESWLKAEDRFNRRPILEQVPYSVYSFGAGNLPTGVYELNPLSDIYAKGSRFAGVERSDGGSSMGWYETREEAEAFIAEQQAFTRNFWEEKVAWRENGDTMLPNYRNRGEGQMVLRIDGLHMVPSYLGFRPNDRNDCKGFGGAKLYWKFIEGPRAGDKVYCSDSVYSQGRIPEYMLDRLPDNAIYTDENGNPKK